MQPPLPNDGVEMGLCHAMGLGVRLHKVKDMGCLWCTLFDWGYQHHAFYVLSDVENDGTRSIFGLNGYSTRFQGYATGKRLR